MKKLIIFILLTSLSISVFAADIFVQAGNNTITAALATADPGDVLVLVEEGVYANDPLFIYKPITIKAFDGLASKPIVSYLWGPDSATIAEQERTLAFTYASLTLEGLELTMEGDSALTDGLVTRMFRNRAFTGVNWNFSDCLIRDVGQATMSISGVVDTFMIADGSYYIDGRDYVDNDGVIIDGDTVATMDVQGVLDTLIIDNCIFKDLTTGAAKINHAPSHGRGVYYYTRFTNNTVYNVNHHALNLRMRDVNEGTDETLYGVAEIDHNTFHGVTKDGIMLKWVNPNSYITNTTISDVGGKAINVLVVNVPVDYSNWFNVTTGPSNKWVDGGNNLQVDPLFTDASTGDLTLAANSPLIGAGSDGSTIGDPRWEPTVTTVDPTASFTVDVDSGDAPLTVTFTNTSDLGTGTLVSYAWDFGDEATSTEENPTHEYTSAGVYDAILTVETTDGVDSDTTTITVTEPVGVEDVSPIPFTFSLQQNYPNPFNPTTSISFALPEAGMVNLSVYNGLGQQIKTIRSEHMPAGRYQVTWDGTDSHGSSVPSGIYIYQLSSGEQTLSNKMVLMK